MSGPYGYDMRGYYGHHVGQTAAVPGPQIALPDPVGDAQKARWIGDGAKAVANANRQHRAPFFGYFRAGNHHEVYPFISIEDAFKWFESVTDDRVRRQRMGERANYDYMAIFNTLDLRQPAWHEFPHFWDPQPGPSGMPAAIGQAVDPFSPPSQLVNQFHNFIVSLKAKGAYPSWTIAETLLVFAAVESAGLGWDPSATQARFAQILAAYQPPR